jgi:hypothetical protein
MNDETSLPVAIEPVFDPHVEASIEQPQDFTVFATNPADMIGAQKSIIEWCEQKSAAEKSEMAEAQTNLDAAKAHKWSSKGWANEVTKHAKKVEFYDKIKMALEAGYYIVPPFPIDLFAIRTKKYAPGGGWETYQWRDHHEKKAQILPAGHGDYVSPDPVLQKHSFQEPDGKGGQKMVPHWRASEWKEADFPFKLAKAEIMHATRAAMALKIFDQMGALPTHRAPDPIICGQILFPNHTGYGPRKAVTFFVSWWLDTKTL